MLYAGPKLENNAGADAFAGSDEEVIEARGGRSTLNKRLDVMSAASSPNGVPVVVGRWYDGAFHAGNPSTAAGAANRFDLGPYFTSQPMRIDRVAVAVTAAVAGSLVKIVIYDSDANGVPDQLIYESESLDCSSTGGKEAVVDLTFEPNRIYWVGARSNSSATIRSILATSALNFGMTSSAASTYIYCLRRTLLYATPAPQSWVYDANEAVSATTPSIRMRAQSLA